MDLNINLFSYIRYFFLCHINFVMGYTASKRTVTI